MLAPWVSYVGAGAAKMSGIVAILTNGVVLSSYATPNISHEAQHILHAIFETVAYTSETAVFCMMGIGVFAINHPYTEFGPWFFFSAMLNLNLARFLNVVICTALVNCVRPKEARIPWKTQFVMWYGGLRGAMAYALALSGADKFETGGIILLETLLYSLFTILIQASFLNPILVWAGVVGASPDSTENKDEGDTGSKFCFDRFKAWF